MSRNELLSALLAPFIAAPAVLIVMAVDRNQIPPIDDILVVSFFVLPVSYGFTWFIALPILHFSRNLVVWNVGKLFLLGVTLGYGGFVLGAFIYNVYYLIIGNTTKFDPFLESFFAPVAILFGFSGAVVSVTYGLLLIYFKRKIKGK